MSTKTESHSFNCFDGTIVVTVDITHMDAIEACDVYGLDNRRFCGGGWRIEGMINNTPRGTLFESGNLGSDYWGGTSEHVARRFLQTAREEGFLPAIPRGTPA